MITGEIGSITIDLAKVVMPPLQENLQPAKSLPKLSLGTCMHSAVCTSARSQGELPQHLGQETQTKDLTQETPDKDHVQLGDAENQAPKGRQEEENTRKDDSLPTPSPNVSRHKSWNIRLNQDDQYRDDILQAQDCIPSNRSRSCVISTPPTFQTLKRSCSSSSAKLSSKRSKDVSRVPMSSLSTSSSVTSPTIGSMSKSIYQSTKDSPQAAISWPRRGKSYFIDTPTTLPDPRDNPSVSERIPLIFLS